MFHHLKKLAIATCIVASIGTASGLATSAVTATAAHADTFTGVVHGDEYGRLVFEGGTANDVVTVTPGAPGWITIKNTAADMDYSSPCNKLSWGVVTCSAPSGRVVLNGGA